MDQVNYIRTQIEVLSQRYTIRLDRELTTPSDFQEELATLRMASHNDIVHILLNGPGGNDTVMKAFLNTMAQSEAHIITEIEGQCCSALTIIFLAGHEFRVSDDSEFMIHTSSFGYSGKENNVRQFVEFNAKANSRLMQKYYRHFLTEEEIEQCIEGRDFWMDADEIMERLERRKDLFEKELEKEEQEGIDRQLEEILGEQPTEEEILEMPHEELQDFVLGRGKWSIEDEQQEDETCSVCNDEALGDIQRIDHLMQIADDMEIKYPHNIGIEKLRQKILDCLKE